MISLSSFLNESDMLVEFLLGGESNTIDSLQTVIGSLSEPVSRRVLQDLEGLNTASVGYMRASAKIDQVSIAVGSYLTTVRDFIGNELSLERIVSKKSQRFFLGEDDSLEHLFLADDFLCCLLNGFVILLREMPSVSAISVIEETTVSWGTVA